jgi:uncharacterized integral membrane protein
MKFRLVLSLALVAVAAVFILQNAAVVEVRFLFWKIGMSRAVWMLLLLAIGVILGWLLHSYARHRRA